MIDVDQLATIRRYAATGRRLCSLPLCERVHASRGMCRTHLKQCRRTGNPLPTRTVCAVDGCRCGGKAHATTIVVARPARRTPGVPGWLDLDRLARTVPRGSWWARAACVGQDTARWFPAGGDHETLAAARATCHGCPVLYECLADQLTHATTHVDVGMWGATSQMERRRIRAALAARAAA